MRQTVAVNEPSDPAGHTTRTDPVRPDPGGPHDPTVAPQPVRDVARPAWFTLMAPGWMPPPEQVTQALGICFTAEGLAVMVTWDEQRWTFPGGTVEPAETIEAALVREVAEEACAFVDACEYLACQHMADPHHPGGAVSYYQTPLVDPRHPAAVATPARDDRPSPRSTAASTDHPVLAEESNRPAATRPGPGRRTAPPPADRRASRLTRPGHHTAARPRHRAGRDPRWECSMSKHTEFAGLGWPPARTKTGLAASMAVRARAWTNCDALVGTTEPFQCGQPQLNRGRDRRIGHRQVTNVLLAGDIDRRAAHPTSTEKGPVTL